MALAAKSQQAVECVEQFQRYLAARPLPSAQCQGDPPLSRSDFRTPEEVNEVYRRRARFYDWSVNTYYLIGFRWWAYRRRAIAALQLGRGATVVEIGCGTGLNFGLVQQRIGPTGRLFGVDLCADMLEKARQRVAAKGWDNVELIRARATDFDFPAGVEAAFSTFALSLEPRFDEVIAKAAATLAPGGRFVLLDLRMPDNWLRHLAPALIRLVRPFAVSIEVAKRQPWKSLRQHFPQYSYQKGYLGIVYIAIGQS
jgi:ubiquinone/menaquinone biosynthesis C-methylase UbiE